MKQAISLAGVMAMAAALVIAAAQSPLLPLPAAEATNGITKTDLKRHLSFLASDELGGRYTFSPGNRIAARYLAAQLESYGFRGAAKSAAFFQKVPLSYRTVDVRKSALKLAAAGKTLEFKYGEDFIAEKPFEAELKGDLVFAGYGVSAAQQGHDDYRGLDVA